MKRKTYLLIMIIFFPLFFIALDAKAEEYYSNNELEEDNQGHWRWLSLGYGLVEYDWVTCGQDPHSGTGFLIEYIFDTKKGLFAVRSMYTKENSGTGSLWGSSWESDERASATELGLLYNLYHSPLEQDIFISLSSGLGIVAGKYKANKVVILDELGFGSPLFFFAKTKTKYELIDFVTWSIPLELQMLIKANNWGIGFSLFGDWNRKMSFYGISGNLYFNMSPADKNS